MGIRNLSTASVSTGAKRSKFWDQSAVWVPPNNFESIATLTSGGGAVTFSSIPQTYRHLQLRVLARSSVGGRGDNINLRFNGDTSTNYGSVNFLTGGQGGPASFSMGNNRTALEAIMCITGNSVANQYFVGGGILDIYDYTSTTKHKSVTAWSGYEPNDTYPTTQQNQGLWFKAGSGTTSEAINSITISDYNGASWYGNNTFALYGVK
jgi:hypothetical protein